MLRPTYLVGITLIAGCVTVTPEAERVQIHAQASNLLDRCEQIGPVRADVGRVWGPDHATETAKVRLREAAHAKGGDTVVLLNRDVYLTRVTLQGVALRCYARD